jgi:DNA repair exonuclease SbcCD ATPase subunit
MKILKLTANNFKKLSAVEITPDGNMVIISGKNAAGKSSVLDSIEAALRGGRYLPKEPIKTGEIRAKVEAVLGGDGEVVTPEYIVTRKFFGTNSTLTVETTGENKSQIRSPQTFLDKIVGDISFDPLAFMRKTSVEQRTTLMDFLGLNLDEFDNKIVALKTQRSDLNKEKIRKLHEVESIQFVDGLPEKEQGADNLLAELQNIRDHNDGCQKIIVENASMLERLRKTDEDIHAAEEAVHQWQIRLAKLREQKVGLAAQVLEIPLSKDPAEVEQKIRKLSETNEAIRQNNRKKMAKAVYDECVAEYARLGDEIKITENNKARKMAEAVMPLKGLSIRPDGLAFDNLPLEQVNDAKKLEICVAIAMALNPELKVLRINGNDLDSEGLAILGQLVAGKDYQVWVEKVTDDNTIGFYIEDGSIQERENDEP